ncbi:MAG: LysR substrate-binding domain-containing protein, partial [Hyphomonas sp.]|uniref:LysR family transcriptional regulator n=1 Tax=Hyphomonas sp. TaxID=87 RepID=UPI0034A05BBA
MHIDGLNIRHLRAFAKIYELGTLLAAARAVHVTQPAVTQGLARLEIQIGATLFDRHSGGMRPTQAADILYPRAMRAIGLIRSNRVSHAQVRAFTALAKCGSYAGASNATGLARASLHRAVSDLELALAQTLVERRGRGIVLTRQGEAAARRFNLAGAELSAAIDEINSLSGQARGRIAVGAMPLCRARVLPAAIVAFQKRHPATELLVAEGSHFELVEPLRDGELDILIGALRDPPPGQDLVQFSLFDDQPVIVARAGHFLASCSEEPDLALLAAYEWCVPPRGVPLRDRWEEMFQNQNLPAPRVRVQCGSVMTIRQILIETDCLTILSPDQIAVELEAGWLQIVSKAPESLVRQIGVTHRAGW